MSATAKPGQRVLIALRRLIATGELKAGERIAEIPTAVALGVSRMPVRTALRVLAEEGLVVRCGARGYAPRDLSGVDVRAALRVRGALEGLAAQQTAERGLGSQMRARLSACLRAGDDALKGAALAPASADQYFEANRAFHQAILEASGNAAIEIALARINALPFASASAPAINLADPEGELAHLKAAQTQHHKVFDAIDRGDARAAQEAMSEHAFAAVLTEAVFERQWRGR